MKEKLLNDYMSLLTDDILTIDEIASNLNNINDYLSLQYPNNNFEYLQQTIQGTVLCVDRKDTH